MLRSKRHPSEIDGINERICGHCLEKFPRTLDYFHKNAVNSYGLSTVCKKCNNLYRNAKHKEKAYYHIPRRCKTCDTFFYASKAQLNKGRRRNSKNWGIFCSIKCAHNCPELKIRCGMRGKSWNGKRRGENNPALKYSEEIVKQIKNLIRQGVRNRDIASKFNLQPSYVSQIRCGNIWSHITI